MTVYLLLAEGTEDTGQKCRGVYSSVERLERGKKDLLEQMAKKGERTDGVSFSHSALDLGRFGLDGLFGEEGTRHGK